MKTIGFPMLSIFAALLCAAAGLAQVEPRPPAESPPPLNPLTLSPDDMARFLGGMPVPKNSPLAPLTNEPAWQAHASFFEDAFGNLVRGKLAKFNALQKTYIRQKKNPLRDGYF